MKQSKHKVMAATPHVVFADTRKPKSIREFFQPKFSFALLETSYPILLVGSCGSGRTSAITSLLAQNIRDEMPFVYINGEGTVALYTQLYAYAQEHKCSEDLFYINFLTPGPEFTHTFDPINPLIGDSASFNEVFGPAFGYVLHDLCRCEQHAGVPVDAERLKSFLSLEDLELLRRQEKYSFAKETVSEYLASLEGLDNEPGRPFRRNGSLLQHELNIANAKHLVEMMETIPVFSTNPDVDFAQLFQMRKFLLVSLPALERDPEVLGVLNTLFACLLSRATDHFPKGTAHPAVVFDACFDFPVLDYALSSRFSHTNTVFAHTEYPREDRVNYLTFWRINRMARSVITMRLNSWIPDSIKASAMDCGVGHKLSVRDSCDLDPGHSFAWGAIGVVRGKTIRKLVGGSLFVFRRVDWERPERIRLSRHRMDE